MTDQRDELTQADVDHIMRVVNDAEFDYVELETGGLKLKVARSGHAGPLPTPSPEADREPAPAAPSEVDTGGTEVVAPVEAAVPGTDGESPVAEGHSVTAPVQGILYHRPEPTAPPFVAVGSKVREGETLALIEAMKTYTAVKADAAGTVIRVAAEDGQPVTHGQLLFVIRES